VAAIQPSVSTAEEPLDRGLADVSELTPAMIGALLAVAVAVAIVFLYVLWEFWPTGAVLKSQKATPVHFLGIHRHVTVDVRLFVIVALAGALGGLLHSTRSFAWYVGHGGLRWRWLPYYITTLVTGAGLSTIVYVVVRGGLFSSASATGDSNPFGFVAVGAIVGLFTEQALEMLRRVANDFFAAAPQGADPAPTDAAGLRSDVTTPIPDPTARGQAQR
jgi:hypothetical protein